MKASGELHQLIKSMSMSEKRHFKLFSSGHINGDSKNYLRLFDAIDRQENYNEEEIKTTFEKETFIRHLPSEKNYLYSNLLESLNAFHKEKTFLARHANFLVSIELLFNRGLFTQSLKLIRKAKAEALLTEKFSILLIILRWETLIYINNEDAKNLNRGIAEELRILDIMKVQTTLMQIAFNIQIQIDKGKVSETFLTKQLEELRKNYAVRPDLRSFWINYYYQSGIGLIYTVQNKHPKRYGCFKEIKSIMDKSPQFIVDLPSIYHSNSNNLVNVMCYLGKYEEAAQTVKSQKEFLQTYKIKRETLSRIVFLNTSESELFIFYKTKKYSAAAALVKEIEARVRKIELNFNPILFDTMYMMAVSELMVKNFKVAGKWLNQILNAEREIKFRKELQINARILYIILLFESHDRLFENRLNAARRFVMQEPQFAAQLKTLEAIRILADAKLLKKHRSELPKFISQIRKESRRMNEETLNKQFDFALWIEEALQEY
jgi:hypothetical protein